ncbi:MAG: hypothetical protein HUJ53_04640 [Holdemanella sp.]|nr:hypothetical protein [Holdemanella sp.]
MSYCLAMFLKKIETVLLGAISEEDLINLLIKSIVTGATVKNRNDELLYIDKQRTSKIMNNQSNVPLPLRKVLSNDITSVDSLEQHFEKELRPILIPEKMQGLCCELTDYLISCDELPEEIAIEVEQCNKEKKHIRLIALAFRYSLMVPNKINNSINRHKKNIIDKKKPVAMVINNQEVEELLCFQAIIAAYRSRTGKTQGISIDEFPQYKKHFQRQKEAYFAAEAVRHATRDSLFDEENLFDDLLDESYEGVIETWEQRYPDGFERMEAVLSQAVQISMESNLIARETVWISTRVKKGLCHILVNDGRIEGWVYDENI